MKKLLLLLGIVFLSVSFVSAIVNSIDYNDIDIKVYSDKLDIDSVTFLLGTINSHYLAGIRQISVFDVRKRGTCADYEWGTSHIRIFKNELDEGTLWHELAHHCQKLKGDKLIKSQKHKGYFCSCLAEISDYSFTDNYVRHCK